MRQDASPENPGHDSVGSFELDPSVLFGYFLCAKESNSRISAKTVPGFTDMRSRTDSQSGSMSRRGNNSNKKSAHRKGAGFPHARERWRIIIFANRHRAKKAGASRADSISCDAAIKIHRRSGIERIANAFNSNTLTFCDHAKSITPNRSDRCSSPCPTPTRSRARTPAANRWTRRPLRGIAVGRSSRRPDPRPCPSS